MFAYCTGDSDQIKLLQIYFLKIHHAEIPCMGHKNHARQKKFVTFILGTQAVSYSSDERLLGKNASITSTSDRFC